MEKKIKHTDKKYYPRPEFLEGYYEGARGQQEHERCNQMLRRLMEERGMSPAQLCKKSGVDPRTLSKILNSDERKPTVETLAYLSIGLQLSFEEANELFRSAGQALKDTDPFDIAISTCLKLGIYDLDKVDQVIRGSSEGSRLRGD